MGCNNSSNINVIKTYVTVTNGGSRLMITIPDSKCANGVTAGSVIRYDPAANLNTGLYKLSTANGIANSEVVGIVESVNTDRSKNVVIYGSINLPNTSIEDVPVGYNGGSGGSDIYFLSPTSSGKLRNSAPTDLTHIVKPIYQAAPHGNGSYTGVVMNYVGYKIDGADISSPQQSYRDYQTYASGVNVVDPDSNSGIGLIKFMLVDTEIGYTVPDTFVDMRVSHILPISEYPDYFSIFGYYDSVYIYNNTVNSLKPPCRLFIEHAIADSTHIVNSSNIGKYIFIRGSQAYYAKIIDYDPVNNAYLISHGMSLKSQNVTRTSTEEPNREHGICNAVNDTTSLVGWFKFTTVSPYGYHTPKMIYTGTIGDGSALNLNFTIVPILKVKKETQGGASFVENNSFRTTTLEINNENVNFVLTDFENRLQALETRLML